MRLKITIIGVSLLTVLSIVAGCGGDRPGQKSASTASDSVLIPDAEVFGAQIEIYDKGELTTRILADKIVKYESIDSTMGYGLDIDFYDTTGSESSHLVGDSGIIREDAGRFHIFGNVVVVTNDGRRLETDELSWAKDTDKITTDAFVRITRGNDVVTGWGLVANSNLSQVTIKRASGEMSDSALVK